MPPSQWSPKSIWRLVRAPLLSLFMAIAAFGFVASVIAHLLALAHGPIPGGEKIFALHAGIFIVWIPAVMLMGTLTKGARRSDIWKIGLMGCPRWVKPALTALGAYVAVNFFRGIAMQHREGDDFLERVRLFSGHWIIFYAIATAIMYSALHVSQDRLNLRCLLGHKMSPADSFCPECGNPKAGPVVP